jgi:uncharacterized membrane protein
VEVDPVTESISAEIEVEAPLRDVYEQWARLTDMPLYMSVVKSVVQVSADRTHWVVGIGGVEREFDARLTEATPNQRIAWESEGEAIHTGAVRFTSVDAERTRVVLEMTWLPERFTEKAGAALGLDRRAAEADLERFRDLLEERNGHTRGTDPDLGI